MQNTGITLLAVIAAIQIIFFGLLAMATNSWVLGFLCGITIPECIHTIRRMRRGDYD